MLDPDYTSPPGASVQETCSAKGMTTAELALRMGLPGSYMQMILSGECPLTRDVTEGLERHLGVPRAFWEALEDQHQKRKMIIASREHQAARRTTLWCGLSFGFAIGALLTNVLWCVSFIHAPVRLPVQEVQSPVRAPTPPQ